MRGRGSVGGRCMQWVRVSGRVSQWKEGNAVGLREGGAVRECGEV